MGEVLPGAGAAVGEALPTTAHSPAKPKMRSIRLALSLVALVSIDVEAIEFGSRGGAGATYCPNVTFKLYGAWPLHANVGFWIAPWESSALLHLRLPPHANVSDIWSATVDSLDLDSGETTFRLASYYTDNFGSILSTDRLVNWTDVAGQCGRIFIDDQRQPSGQLDAQPVVAVLLRAGATLLSPDEGAALSDAVARSVGGSVDYLGSYRVPAPTSLREQLANSSDGVAAALLQLPSQDSVAKLAGALRRHKLHAGAVSDQLNGALLEAERPDGLNYVWVAVGAGGGGGVSLAVWLWAPLLVVFLGLVYLWLRWRRRSVKQAPTADGISPSINEPGKEPLLDAAHHPAAANQA